MQTKHLVRILLIIALGLVLPSGGEAAVVGHFTEVEGRVDLMKAGNLPALPVKVQDGIEPGDVVRTKSLSRAQLKFVDDTVLTISPESRVAIEKYMYDGQKGQRQAVLEIFRGLVHTAVAKIIKTEKPDFIIKTQTTTMGVRGTTWYTVLSPQCTDVYNESGKLCVENIFPEITGQVCLETNQFCRVEFSLPPTMPMNYTPEDVIQLKLRLSPQASRGSGVTPSSGTTGSLGTQLLSGSSAGATENLTPTGLSMTSQTTQNVGSALTGGIYIPPSAPPPKTSSTEKVVLRR